MRTSNSIKNISAALLANFTTIVVGIIAQKIFIQILGSEYLGLNSLFSNIISMLGIVETGIGSAIIYSLYKPIADNDVEQIKSLMRFYKKSYMLIGIVVCFLGIIIVPFLQYIVDFNAVTIDIKVYYVYFLFLFESVFSYFLSYKRSILYATQENRIINLVHIGYTIILNILQLIVLKFTKNYYLYLIVKIVMKVLENIMITEIANKKYGYLKDKNINKLDKTTEREIFKKVRALFFHRIGGFVVNGTDNIIISRYLSLAIVGFYSNYYLIINAVQTVFSQMIQSTMASVGNLLVTESKDKCYDVFKKVRFLNFWIATFSAIAVLIIMESFISIWLGREYILATTVLFILVINLYQQLSSNTYYVFKVAAGVFYEDRFIPVIESLLNIVFSIIGCKLFGLAGIFVGTIISGLSLWCFSFPKYVYKKLFDRKYTCYIIETFGYFLCFLGILLSSYFIANLFVINNPWLLFIYNVLFSLIFPNTILLFIFFKTDNFKYYLNLVKRVIKNERKN